MIANSITKIFKQITVDRNIFCGIRTCAYLISSGLILGRASAGDWTSFQKTVEEFVDGWPVLLLTVLFIMVELLFVNQKKQDLHKIDHGKIGNSDKYILTLLIGVVYISITICAVYYLPPLPINPLYK